MSIALLSGLGYGEGEDSPGTLPIVLLWHGRGLRESVEFGRRHGADFSGGPGRITLAGWSLGGKTAVAVALDPGGYTPPRVPGGAGPANPSGCFVPGAGRRTSSPRPRVARTPPPAHRSRDDPSSPGSEPGWRTARLVVR